MRHDGCGGRPAKAELLTGVEEAPAGRCCGAAEFGDWRGSTRFSVAPVTYYPGDRPPSREDSAVTDRPRIGLAGRKGSVAAFRVT